MSDTAPADGSAAPAEAPAGTPTDTTGRPVPPPPPPASAETIAAFEAVGGEGGEPAVPEEVRKLRAEAAKWRTQLRDTEAVAAPFAALNENNRAALAEAAEALASGDNASAAAMFANWAQTLGGGQPVPAPAYEQADQLDIQGMIDQAVERAIGGIRQETAREAQIRTVTEQVNEARAAVGITAGDDKDEAVRAVALRLMQTGTIGNAKDAYTEGYRRLYGELPEGTGSHDGPGGQTSLTPPASGEPAVQQREPAADRKEARRRLRETMEAAGFNTQPGVQ